LRLSSSKAREELGWYSKLDTKATIAWTIEGYKALFANGDVSWLPDQIDRFEAITSSPTVKRLQGANLNAVA
jgi:hypothetical protein